MALIPSCIEIAGIYYATVKSKGVEDVLKDKNGQKIPFQNSRDAVKAAMRKIEEDTSPPSAPVDIKVSKEDEIVLSWREERLKQREQDREMATLLGIEVVTIKRRKVVGNGKAGGPV